jgi:myo-inositol catabolism protein IolS
VYFIHWPNIDLPIDPAMEELERMRRDGLIRAIGVSNFMVPEMETARQHGRIDVLQPPYNLFWRTAERAEALYCLRHGIGIITYSSLAKGLLTGTLTRATAFSPDDQRTSTVLIQPEVYVQCLDAVDQLRPIAQRNGKTVAQLAIRWLTGQPAVTTALLGARTVDEIEENVRGVDWTLSAADAALVETAARPIAERVAAYPDMFGQLGALGSPAATLRAERPPTDRQRRRRERAELTEADRRGPLPFTPSRPRRSILG